MFLQLRKTFNFFTSTGTEVRSAHEFVELEEKEKENREEGRGEEEAGGMDTQSCYKAVRIKFASRSLSIIKSHE